MDISPQMQDALARALIVMLIVILTLFFRRIASRVAYRLINSLWRVMNAVRHHDSTRDREIADAITPPLRLLIAIAGLQLIFLVVTLPEIFAAVRAQFINSLGAIAVFWAIYRLVDVAAKYLEENERFAALDHTLLRFGKQMIKWLIVLIAFIVVMEEWGFDLAGLVAGLGIGGLAVALAAQDALANLIGYFVIIMDSPFKVNHYIEVDDEEGFVEDISFRSTRLRKRDRSLVIIPNKTVVDSSITNWSRLNRRQINMTLGVTYNTPEDKIRAVIKDIHDMLENHERVTTDRKLVEFVEFGASSLDILIIYFASTIVWDEMQRIKADVNMKILGILTQQGVSVAFPTTTFNFDYSADDLLEKSGRIRRTSLVDDGDARD